jgi:hypothetical protein
LAQSIFTLSPSPASGQGSLLTPGDRVAFTGEPASAFEIVHISHQKAWVRSLRCGSQQIVAMGDLCLIEPALSARPSLH